MEEKAAATFISRMNDGLATMDDGIDLVGEVLPGWRLTMRQRRPNEGGGWFVRIESPDYHAEIYSCGGKTTRRVRKGRGYDTVSVDPCDGIIWCAQRALGRALLDAAELEARDD